MEIKSSLFTVFLFLFGTVSVQGQEVITPDKHLKGGLSFSRLHNTGWESSAAPGFVFGISLDFRLSQAFSVQPEVMYHEKGGRESVSSLNTEFNLVMDYIEVPLLAKYHLPAEGLFRPHIYLGPYAGFLIENNSNTEVANDNQFTPDNLIVEAEDTEYGAIIGIGTDLHFTFNTIRAEIRYSAGLSDAFNDTVSQKIRTGSFVFMVGFSF